MKLLFSDRHPLSSDAFGAAIFEDELCIPVEFTEICRETDVKTAEDLLSMMQVFPHEVSGSLGWTTERFQRAYVGLLAVLKGKVGDVFLRPPSPPRSTSGAKPPPDHPVQIGYTVSDEDLED